MTTRDMPGLKRITAERRRKAKCPRRDKVPYSTRAAAAAARQDAGIPDLNVYQCACEAWHLGSARSDLTQRIKDALS